MTLCTWIWIPLKWKSFERYEIFSSCLSKSMICSRALAIICRPALLSNSMDGRELELVPFGVSFAALLQEGAVLGLALGVLGGDDHGGGYFVVGVEVEELDAHGGSTGGANGFGVDADDLAELGDDHHLGGVVD